MILVWSMFFAIYKLPILALYQFLRYKENQGPSSLKWGFGEYLRFPIGVWHYDDHIDIINVFCYINIQSFDRAKQMFMQSNSVQSSSCFGRTAKSNMAQMVQTWPWHGLTK